MTTVHTNIPNTVLPTALTDPNKIVTEYESFTLIPRLGPLSYAYITRFARRRLWFITRTLVLLDVIAVHKATWNSKPDLALLTLNAVAATDDTFPGGRGTDPESRFRGPSREERLAVGPQILLDTVRRLPDASVGLSAGAVRAETAATELRRSQQAESDRDVLNILREPNPVINRLVENGKLLDAEGGIRDELIEFDAAGRLSAILDAAPSATAEPSRFVNEISKSVAMSALATDHSLAMLNHVVKDNRRLESKVVASVAEAIGNLDRLVGVSAFDDTPIVDSREWAFLRRERVEMLLKPPLFRGPLSVNSVAPNSELTLTDSQTAQARTLNISASQSARTSGNNILISNQIKDKLGTLHDFGSNLGQTMSEQGYEKDGSKGEKRTIMEQTLSEISESNASQTISVSATGAASTREYKTRGNDTNFATTEVSFEVFSPVSVTHFLDSIGAVWCPRMKNPYGVLRQTIADYEEQVRAEYITENHIVDPAEPLPTYEGLAAKTGNASPKIPGDDIADDTKFDREVTISLSAQERTQGYFLDDSVKCELIQESEWDENELDADQYDILDAVILEHVENSHIRIKTRLKVHDEPGGYNPSWVWIRVTVNKYKYTASYLQQLKEYRNTVNELNPARRAAVEAQARRYARLKKEELIKRYANNPAELREYTFITLMRQMFGNGANWSYYHGIIKTCVDWERAHIQPEPAKPENLAADGLSPFHFLNVVAVRFFLPIHDGSEDAFFEAVGNTLDNNWRALFAKVKTYIGLQRSKVKTMTDRMDANDIKELTLDEYDSELVLGRHLEAVLSQTTFLES